MSDLVFLFSSAIIMGLGATPTFDLWGQLLSYFAPAVSSDVPGATFSIEITA